MAYWAKYMKQIQHGTARPTGESPFPGGDHIGESWLSGGKFTAESSTNTHNSTDIREQKLKIVAKHIYGTKRSKERKPWKFSYPSKQYLYEIIRYVPYFLLNKFPDFFWTKQYVSNKSIIFCYRNWTILFFPIVYEQTNKSIIFFYWNETIWFLYVCLITKLKRSELA